MFTSHHDAIIIRDPESHIVAWNHGAEALYGWTEQEAVGTSIHPLLSTRFPQSREAIDLALTELGHWEGSLTHICRNGKHLIVHSRQVLVRDEAGQPTAILEINRDVTEQERLLHEQAEARARELALLQREEAMICVEVADSGPGLSPVHQQQIWDRFSRVEGITVKAGSGIGLGLGLYICRNLIEGQGGRVGVESQPGQGSTFWFTLPLAEPESC